MQSVFLVGFMGSGKTTVGRILAWRMKLPFCDLDALIEESARMSVAEIFRERGEAAFREEESRRLESLAFQPPMVAALGGGAFSTDRNRRVVQLAGACVWLSVPLETAWARCAADPERPLAADRETFERLFNQRLADYRLADLHVNTEGKNPQWIAAEIQRRLKRRRKGKE